MNKRRLAYKIGGLTGLLIDENISNKTSALEPVGSYLLRAVEFDGSFAYPGFRCLAFEKPFQERPNAVI